MAFAPDATSDSVGKGSAPRTWSHTCSGDGRLLIVLAFATTDIVSGVTYNGVAMTLIAKSSFPGAGHREGVYMYYLVNPASGSHTISVNGSGSVGGIASSYKSASQTGQPDSTNNANPANGSNITLTTTVIAATCWLIGCCADNFGAGTTAGTGTTIRIQDSGGFGLSILDSNAIVGTGSQSLVLNFPSGTHEEAYVVGSFLSSTANTISLATGTYTLTGYNLLFSYGRKIVLGTGSYVLTGYDLAFSLVRKWIDGTKSSSVSSNTPLHNSTWVDGTKSTDTFTNNTKH